MVTPIWDILQQYAQTQGIRLHMPAHKGQGALGVEPWDITEIEGIEPLYSGKGVLWQSQQNAAHLFGSEQSLYSVEGSSLCIRAMVALLVRYAQQKGVRPLILAARNVHSAFLGAVATCRAEVEWLYGADDYITCPLTARSIEAALDRLNIAPVALYVTSPDYLGNRLPLLELAQVCKRRGILLAVDNAHGAYLHFVDNTHPMDAGADLCCDSAHKTLPALTPCAYLHIGHTAPAFFAQNALWAMRLFATTSPGFVQLASLDRLNAYLADYPPIAQAYAAQVQAAKQTLAETGYRLVGDEPYKITLDAIAYGYTGHKIATYLRQHNIEPEMSTERYVVMMLSPALAPEALEQVLSLLQALPRKAPIAPATIAGCRPQAAMPLWQAVWSSRISLPLADCHGKILADSPCRHAPEVSLIVPGEVIDDIVLQALAAKDVDRLDVVE